MTMHTKTHTADAYSEAFGREAFNVYPAVDALEVEYGYAMAVERYLDAARVLACPVKASPPNWQHGRVLYSVTRRYLEGWDTSIRFFNMLDVGTAKGYSALCLLWALKDAGKAGQVVSVDVIDPIERVRRNTIAEVDGYLTLADTMKPWPEAQEIAFRKSTGQAWLTANPSRIHVAFLDGKHSYEAVSWEASLLASRQRPGDVVMFDDVHMPAVRKAVSELKTYDVRYLELKPERHYALGRRQ